MSTTIQQVPTDTYGLDPVHSSFGFGVRYNGLATFRSSFDKVDAQLADGVLTGSADVSSIVIDEPRFKGHVLAADFFDVENTPTITFRSTDIRPAEDGSVEVDGELTIRGVTKAVTATGTYATGGDAFGNDRVALRGADHRRPPRVRPRLADGQARRLRGAGLRRDDLGRPRSSSSRPERMRILGISGSLRAGSWNTALLQAAAERWRRRRAHAVPRG